MHQHRPEEEEEWVADRIESWVETYKKAMLTPVILRIVAVRGPVSIPSLLAELIDHTGWQITERGFYRTVKRLQDSGLLASEDRAVPRTGVKRKALTLPMIGAQYLAGIERNLIDLPPESDM